jgi:tetratricopeptide (TPR) repeat protein
MQIEMKAFRPTPGNLLAAAAFLLVIPGPAQTSQPQPVPQSSPPGSTAKPDSERQHAIALFTSGNYVEAMPLFEKLVADHPEDAALKVNWAFSISAYAATLSDIDLRKKARVRARAIALEAQKQGNNSATLQIVLQIPGDGSEPAFSDRKDVDDAMRAAEADFARGDLDKARTGYLRALLLDPKNYAAALFTGDVYFKQHVNGSAGEWFARAAQIDPNRETAYRYWGDALLAMGNSAPAREKYINAIIAEPYTRNSWSGLAQWAQQTNVKLNWIRLPDKCKIVPGESGPKVMFDTSLTSDDPMYAPWLAYSGRRLEWQKEKFKREYPNEAKYRRTLREEADALHFMVLALSTPEAAAHLDPSLAGLVKVDQAGFLEPFALLNRPDNEIAEDYPAYRESHRDTLYRYFDEFVVPQAPQP